MALFWQVKDALADLASLLELFGQRHRLQGKQGGETEDAASLSWRGCFLASWHRKRACRARSLSNPMEGWETHQTLISPWPFHPPYRVTISEEGTPAIRWLSLRELVQTTDLAGSHLKPSRSRAPSVSRARTQRRVVLACS